MKKIKIFYVIGTLGIGGAEKHILTLIQNLDKEKYEFSILCLTQSGPLECAAKAAGANVIPLGLNCDKGKFHPSSYINIVKTFYKMYSIFRKEKPDIVHSYLFMAYIFGVLSARLAGVPITISSRRSLGVYKDKKPYMQPLENFVNRFTDYITVNSKAVMEDLLQREKNVKPEKLALIYNGVDIEKFQKKIDVDAEKKRLGIPAVARVIGVVANLIHYKGHKEIIKSIPEVVKSIPNAYFYFAGRDGGMLAELKQLAKDLNVENRIIFGGLFEDTASLFPVFDIFLLASYEEGFSNAILEGMAAGKPVIATNVGGNPEAVIDGKTGLLIPPHNPEAIAEAIIKILLNDALYKEMCRDALQHVSTNFPVSKMISEIDEFYTRIINNQTLQ